MSTPRSGNAPPPNPAFDPRRQRFGSAMFAVEPPKPKPIVIREGAEVGSFDPAEAPRVKVEPCKAEVKW